MHRPKHTTLVALLALALALAGPFARPRQPTADQLADRRRRFKLIAGFVAMVFLNVTFSTWLMSGNAFGVAGASPLSQSLAAVTSIPTAFSYQGTLRDASGNLVNGTVNLSLRLYGAVTGGSALYTEDFANVNVRDGLFTVIVGDAKVLPASVFDVFPLYLGIKVNTDAEMLPRQRLHPVPYAMQSASAQNAVTAENLAPGGGVPGSVTFGAGGDKAITFPDGGAITDSPNGMTLSGGGVNKTVTVEGGWSAGAILDTGDSNGGPNVTTTYPVSMNRYVVIAPDNGSSPNTVPVNPQILNDYCRDEDGCWVSLYMRNPDGLDVMAGINARHLSLGPVVNNKQHWDLRDTVANSISGSDNNGVINHPSQVFNACYFTDAEYNNGQGSDSAPGFGLLNWYGTWDSVDMICVLIIED